MDIHTDDKVRKKVGHLGHKVPPVVTEVNRHPQITDRIKPPQINFIFIFIITYPIHNETEISY